MRLCAFCVLKWVKSVQKTKWKCRPSRRHEVLSILCFEKFGQSLRLGVAVRVCCHVSRKLFIARDNLIDTAWEYWSCVDCEDGVQFCGWVSKPLEVWWQVSCCLKFWVGLESVSWKEAVAMLPAGQPAPWPCGIEPAERGRMPTLSYHSCVHSRDKLAPTSFHYTWEKKDYPTHLLIKPRDCDEILRYYLLHVTMIHVVRFSKN